MRRCNWTGHSCEPACARLDGCRLEGCQWRCVCIYLRLKSHSLIGLLLEGIKGFLASIECSAHVVLSRAYLHETETQFLPDLDWKQTSAPPVRGKAHIQKLALPVAHAIRACLVGLKLKQAAFLKPGFQTLARVVECYQATVEARRALLPELVKVLMKVKSTICSNRVFTGLAG